VRRNSLHFAIFFELLHDGGYEFFRAVDTGEDGLQVECGDGEVAVGGAVDAMLSDEGERVGEHVHGDGEAAAGGAQHELVFFQIFAVGF